MNPLNLLASTFSGYLSPYLEAEGLKSLRVAGAADRISARNLTLKNLDRFNLPFRIRHGQVGVLTIVPQGGGLSVLASALWGKGPIAIKVVLEDVHLLVDKAVTTPEEVTRKRQAAKEDDLRQDEQAYRNELIDAVAASLGAAASSSSSILSRILDNLQVEILRLHIRYEDTTSRPGRGFAIGLTFDRFSTAACDESEMEDGAGGTSSTALSPPGDARLRYRSAKLQLLTVYWDALSGPSYLELTPAARSAAFSAGVTSSTRAPPHTFLLQPTSPVVTLALNPGLVVPGQPRIRVKARLTQLRADLTRTQVHDAWHLFKWVEAQQYLLMLTTIKQLPGVAARRPTVPVAAAPRAWLQYLMAIERVVIERNVDTGVPRWDVRRIAHTSSDGTRYRVSAARAEYTAAYKRKLHAQREAAAGAISSASNKVTDAVGDKVDKAVSAAVEATLARLEAGFTYEQTLLYRSMARVEYEGDVSAAASKAREAAAKKAAKAEAERARRAGMGWGEWGLSLGLSVFGRSNDGSGNVAASDEALQTTTTDALSSAVPSVVDMYEVALRGTTDAPQMVIEATLASATLTIAAEEPVLSSSDTLSPAAATRSPFIVQLKYGGRALFTAYPRAWSSQLLVGFFRVVDGTAPVSGISGTPAFPVVVSRLAAALSAPALSDADGGASVAAVAAAPPTTAAAAARTAKLGAGGSGGVSSVLDLSDPLLDVSIDALPPGSAADYRARLTGQALLVVFSPSLAGALLSFLELPELDTTVRSAVTDQLKALRSKTADDVYSLLASHARMDVALQLAAPTVIFPEEPSDPQGRRLVARLGTLSLTSVPGLAPIRPALLDRAPSATPVAEAFGVTTAGGSSGNSSSEGPAAALGEATEARGLDDWRLALSDLSICVQPALSAAGLLPPPPASLFAATVGGGGGSGGDAGVDYGLGSRPSIPVLEPVSFTVDAQVRLFGGASLQREVRTRVSLPSVSLVTSTELVACLHALQAGLVPLLLGPPAAVEAHDASLVPGSGSGVMGFEDSLGSFRTTPSYGALPPPEAGTKGGSVEGGETAPPATAGLLLVGEVTVGTVRLCMCDVASGSSEMMRLLRQRGAAGETTHLLASSGVAPATPRKGGAVEAAVTGLAPSPPVTPRSRRTAAWALGTAAPGSSGAAQAADLLLAVTGFSAAARLTPAGADAVAVLGDFTVLDGLQPSGPAFAPLVAQLGARDKPLLEVGVGWRRAPDRVSGEVPLLVDVKAGALQVQYNPGTVAALQLYGMLVGRMLAPEVTAAAAEGEGAGSSRKLLGRRQLRGSPGAATAAEDEDDEEDGDYESVLGGDFDTPDASPTGSPPGELAVGSVPAAATARHAPLPPTPAASVLSSGSVATALSRQRRAGHDGAAAARLGARRLRHPDAATRGTPVSVASTAGLSRTRASEGSSKYHPPLPPVSGSEDGGAAAGGRRGSGVHPASGPGSVSGDSSVSTGVRSHRGSVRARVEDVFGLQALRAWTEEDPVGGQQHALLGVAEGAGTRLAAVEEVDTPAASPARKLVSGASGASGISGVPPRSSRGPAQPSPWIRILLTASFDALSLRLNKECQARHLATVTLGGGTARLGDFPDRLELCAGLQALCLSDDTSCDAPTPVIRFTEAQESDSSGNSSTVPLLSVAFTAYQSDAPSYPGVDSDVKVSLAPLSAVYLAPFITELSDYLVQGLLGTALASAVEGAVAAVSEAVADTSTRARLDVQVMSPRVLLPVSPGAEEGLVVALGDVHCSNAFLPLPDAAASVASCRAAFSGVERLSFKLASLAVTCQGGGNDLRPLFDTSGCAAGVIVDRLLQAVPAPRGLDGLAVSPASCLPPSVPELLVSVTLPDVMACACPDSLALVARVLAGNVNAPLVELPQQETVPSTPEGGATDLPIGSPLKAGAVDFASSPAVSASPVGTPRTPLQQQDWVAVTPGTPGGLRANDLDEEGEDTFRVVYTVRPDRRTRARLPGGATTTLAAGGIEDGGAVAAADTMTPAPLPAPAAASVPTLQLFITLPGRVAAALWLHSQPLLEASLAGVTATAQRASTGSFTASVEIGAASASYHPLCDGAVSPVQFLETVTPHRLAGAAPLLTLQARVAAAGATDVSFDIAALRLVAHAPLLAALLAFQEATAAAAPAVQQLQQDDAAAPAVMRDSGDVLAVTQTQTAIAAAAEPASPASSPVTLAATFGGVTLELPLPGGAALRAHVQSTAEAALQLAGKTLSSGRVALTVDEVWVSMGEKDGSEVPVLEPLAVRVAATVAAGGDEEADDALDVIVTADALTVHVNPATLGALMTAAHTYTAVLGGSSRATTASPPHVAGGEDTAAASGSVSLSPVQPQLQRARRVTAALKWPGTTVHASSSPSAPLFTASMGGFDGKAVVALAANPAMQPVINASLAMQLGATYRDGGLGAACTPLLQPWPLVLTFTSGGEAPPGETDRHLSLNSSAGAQAAVTESLLVEALALVSALSSAAAVHVSKPSASTPSAPAASASPVPPVAAAGPALAYTVTIPSLSLTLLTEPPFELAPPAPPVLASAVTAGAGRPLSHSGSVALELVGVSVFGQLPPHPSADTPATTSVSVTKLAATDLLYVAPLVLLEGASDASEPALTVQLCSSPQRGSATRVSLGSVTADWNPPVIAGLLECLARVAHSRADGPLATAANERDTAAAAAATPPGGAQFALSFTLTTLQLRLMKPAPRKSSATAPTAAALRCIGVLSVAGTDLGLASPAREGVTLQLRVAVRDAWLDLPGDGTATAPVRLLSRASNKADSPFATVQLVSYTAAAPAALCSWAETSAGTAALQPCTVATVHVQAVAARYLHGPVSEVLDYLSRGILEVLMPLPPVDLSGGACAAGASPPAPAFLLDVAVDGADVFVPVSAAAVVASADEPGLCFAVDAVSVRMAPVVRPASSLAVIPPSVAPSVLQPLVPADGTTSGSSDAHSLGLHGGDLLVVSVAGLRARTSASSSAPFLSSPAGAPPLRVSIVGFKDLAAYNLHGSELEIQVPPLAAALDVPTLATVLGAAAGNLAAPVAEGLVDAATAGCVATAETLPYTATNEASSGPDEAAPACEACERPFPLRAARRCCDLCGATVCLGCTAGAVYEESTRKRHTCCVPCLQQLHGRRERRRSSVTDSSVALQATAGNAAASAPQRRASVTAPVITDAKTRGAQRKTRVAVSYGYGRAAVAPPSLLRVEVPSLHVDLLSTSGTLVGRAGAAGLALSLAARPMTASSRLSVTLSSLVLEGPPPAGDRATAVLLAQSSASARTVAAVATGATSEGSSASRLATTGQHGEQHGQRQKRPSLALASADNVAPHLVVTVTSRGTSDTRVQVVLDHTDVNADLRAFGDVATFFSGAAAAGAAAASARAAAAAAPAPDAAVTSATALEPAHALLPASATTVDVTIAEPRLIFLETPAYARSRAVVATGFGHVKLQSRRHDPVAVVLHGLAAGTAADATPSGPLPAAAAMARARVQETTLEADVRLQSLELVVTRVDISSGGHDNAGSGGGSSGGNGVFGLGAPGAGATAPVRLALPISAHVSLLQTAFKLAAAPPSVSTGLPPPDPVSCVSVYRPPTGRTFLHARLTSPVATALGYADFQLASRVIASWNKGVGAPADAPAPAKPVALSSSAPAAPAVEQLFASPFSRPSDAVRSQHPCDYEVLVPEGIPLGVRMIDAVYGRDEAAQGLHGVAMVAIEVITPGPPPPSSLSSSAAAASSGSAPASGEPVPPTMPGVGLDVVPEGGSGGSEGSAHGSDVVSPQRPRRGSHPLAAAPAVPAPFRRRASLSTAVVGTYDDGAGLRPQSRSAAQVLGGLMVSGDVILSVNGVSLHGLNREQAAERVRGVKGPRLFRFRAMPHCVRLQALQPLHAVLLDTSHARDTPLLRLSITKLDGWVRGDLAAGIDTFRHEAADPEASTEPRRRGGPRFVATLSTQRPAPQEVSLSLSTTLALDAFCGASSEWEPVLEPWSLAVVALMHDPAFPGMWVAGQPGNAGAVGSRFVTGVRRGVHDKTRYGRLPRRVIALAAGPLALNASVRHVSTFLAVNAVLAAAGGSAGNNASSAGGSAASARQDLAYLADAAAPPACGPLPGVVPAYTNAAAAPDAFPFTLRNDTGVPLAFTLLPASNSTSGGASPSAPGAAPLCLLASASSTSPSSSSATSTGAPASPRRPGSLFEELMAASGQVVVPPGAETGFAVARSIAAFGLQRGGGGWGDISALVHGSSAESPSSSGGRSHGPSSSPTAGFARGGFGAGAGAAAAPPLVQVTLAESDVPLEPFALELEGTASRQATMKLAAATLLPPPAPGSVKASGGADAPLLSLPVPLYVLGSTEGGRRVLTVCSPFLIRNDTALDLGLFVLPPAAPGAAASSDGAVTKLLPLGIVRAGVALALPLPHLAAPGLLVAPLPRGHGLGGGEEAAAGSADDATALAALAAAAPGLMLPSRPFAFGRTGTAVITCQPPANPTAAVFPSSHPGWAGTGIDPSRPAHIVARCHSALGGAGPAVIQLHAPARLVNALPCPLSFKAAAVKAAGPTLPARPSASATAAVAGGSSALLAAEAGRSLTDELPPGSVCELFTVPPVLLGGTNAASAAARLAPALTLALRLGELTGWSQAAEVGAAMAAAVTPRDAVTRATPPVERTTFAVGTLACPSSSSEPVLLQAETRLLPLDVDPLAAPDGRSGDDAASGTAARSASSVAGGRAAGAPLLASVLTTVVYAPHWIVNATPLPLEFAARVSSQGADATRRPVVPAGLHLPSQLLPDVDELVLEHQRHLGGAEGWGPPLGAGDPPTFADASGWVPRRPPPALLAAAAGKHGDGETGEDAPEAGWVWTGPWTCNSSRGTGVEGWDHALDFADFGVPGRQPCASAAGRLVRRRMWRRPRTRAPTAGAAGSASSPVQGLPLPPVGHTLTSTKLPAPAFAASVPFGSPASVGGGCIRADNLVLFSPPSGRLTARLLPPEPSSGVTWLSKWGRPIETSISGRAATWELTTAPASAKDGAASGPATGYELLVSVSSAPPPFHRSSLVTVRPRIMLVNATGRPLYVRQAGVVPATASAQLGGAAAGALKELEPATHVPHVLGRFSHAPWWWADAAAFEAPPLPPPKGASPQQEEAARAAAAAARLRRCLQASLEGAVGTWSAPLCVDLPPDHSVRNVPLCVLSRDTAQPYLRGPGSHGFTPAAVHVIGASVRANEHVPGGICVVFSLQSACPLRPPVDVLSGPLNELQVATANMARDVDAGLWIGEGQSRSDGGGSKGAAGAQPVAPAFLTLCNYSSCLIAYRQTRAAAYSHHGQPLPDHETDLQLAAAQRLFWSGREGGGDSAAAPGCNWADVKPAAAAVAGASAVSNSGGAGTIRSLGALFTAASLYCDARTVVPLGLVDALTDRDALTFELAAMDPRAAAAVATPAPSGRRGGSALAPAASASASAFGAARAVSLDDLSSTFRLRAPCGTAVLVQVRASRQGKRVVIFDDPLPPVPAAAPGAARPEDAPDAIASALERLNLDTSPLSNPARFAPWLRILSGDGGVAAGDSSKAQKTLSPPAAATARVRAWEDHLQASVDEVAVSVIDAVPSEVLVVTARGIAAHCTSASTVRECGLRLRRLQLDQMDSVTSHSASSSSEGGGGVEFPVALYNEPARLLPTPEGLVRGVQPPLLDVQVCAVVDREGSDEDGGEGSDGRSALAGLLFPSHIRSYAVSLAPLHLSLSSDVILLGLKLARQVSAAVVQGTGVDGAAASTSSGSASGSGAPRRLPALAGAGLALEAVAAVHVPLSQPAAAALLLDSLLLDPTFGPGRAWAAAAARWAGARSRPPPQVCALLAATESPGGEGVGSASTFIEEGLTVSPLTLVLDVRFVKRAAGSDSEGGLRGLLPGLLVDVLETGLAASGADVTLALPPVQGVTTLGQWTAAASSMAIEQLLVQLPRLGLSLNAIGNPLGLYKNVVASVSDGGELFIDSLVAGDLLGGAGSLVGMASASLGAVLGSAADVSSFVGSALASAGSALTSNDGLAAGYAEAARAKPTGLAEGAAGGVKKLFGGIFKGVTGIVTAPIEGAVEGGVGGFFKGAARGLAEAPIRVVGGVASGFSSALQGASTALTSVGDSAGISSGSGSGAARPERVRAGRPLWGPRATLRRYDRESAFLWTAVRGAATNVGELMLTREMLSDGNTLVVTVPRGVGGAGGSGGHIHSVTPDGRISSSVALRDVRVLEELSPQSLALHVVGVADGDTDSDDDGDGAGAGGRTGAYVLNLAGPTAPRLAAALHRCIDDEGAH